MATIEVSGLTKDYGEGRGVFGLDFQVNEGEVMGFLGPNGAGKTTTIRQLMGFIRPDKGVAHINGRDCFTDAATIHGGLGYLPGEIAMPDDMTGHAFLNFYAGMHHVKDLTHAQKLCERFELDDKTRIKRMSKGTKQKLGIVCAFMKDPAVLILDEPTSGLDPLMQNRFIELILEEKARGKTILMSSHMFEEIQRTCERTVIIRSGKLVAVEDISNLQQKQAKTYIARFKSDDAATAFVEKYALPATCLHNDTITLRLRDGLSAYLQALGKADIIDLSTREQTLEDLFLHFYKDGGEDK